LPQHIRLQFPLSTSIFQLSRETGECIPCCRPVDRNWRSLNAFIFILRNHKIGPCSATDEWETLLFDEFPQEGKPHGIAWEARKRYDELPCHNAPDR
jgi:hypothetical protein